MAFIRIDDKELEVEQETSVLEAALAGGIEIPHYCYHPALDIVGSCRMCLVQVEGMDKLQISCNTFIEEVSKEKKVDGKYDAVIHTQNDLVKKEQENILEFLLINHPLDCPVCDQAGECLLQDYSFRYGRAHSRFEENKRVRPNEYLGSRIVINHNRCIMCTRCVRFTEQISGTKELFIKFRGNPSKIAVLEDHPLDNFLAGNAADICPVGALLSTDYIHKNRIWNLSNQSSVCTDCSVGCNIDVCYQDDRIYRITPRENHEVNGYFMCDIGRYGFHRYEDIERVTQPLIRKNGEFSEISWEGALKEVFDHFTRGTEKEKPFVAGIVSPFHTNESNFLLGRLMKKVFRGRSALGMLPPIEEEKDLVYSSGFRISGDRSPNRRGVVDLCPDLVDDILDTIREKKIKLMYVLDDGIDRGLGEGWGDVFRNLRFAVVQTYAMTPMARSAHLVLPGPAPLEREGTLTSDRGRVQWLRPSLPLSGSIRHDWAIVMEVMNTVGKRELKYGDVADILREIGDDFPAYSEISLFRLGDQGLPTDG
ncbi:MAG: molybdopterin-dependent oxidoreductase [Candidatus Neomarinimicrobiota bacterium]